MWCYWYSAARGAAHAREHPPHCHVRPLTRSGCARSCWVVRARGGQQAGGAGGLSHAPLSRRSAGGFRRAARPARAWICLLPLSCLIPPPAAGQIPNEDPFYPNSAPHYSPPHQDLAQTCRTQRAGAGATGSGHGRAGVPCTAAAAAAAPSSAAFGCWRARALARCTLALRLRCARAALALCSRCDTHTPASGKPEPWAVHDDGGSSPSSSHVTPPLLLSLCRHRTCQLSRARSRYRAPYSFLPFAHARASGGGTTPLAPPPWAAYGGGNGSPHHKQAAEACVVVVVGRRGSGIGIMIWVTPIYAYISVPHALPPPLHVCSSWPEQKMSSFGSFLHIKDAR